MTDGSPRSWAEVRAFLAIEVPINDGWHGRMTIRVFRVGQWLTGSSSPWAKLARKPWRLVYRIWVETILGADLPPEVSIGPGVRFAHGGRGVVLHPRATIGARAVIYHRVTVGVLGGRPPKPVPTIGDDVVLSTGCSVLGGIVVGHGVGVGANTAVTTDVEPGCLVVAPKPEAHYRGVRAAD